LANKKKADGFMKEFNISLSFWAYGKLKEFAKANDMKIRAAVRYIINQHFKGKI
jgi:hypothetical protein